MIFNLFAGLEVLLAALPAAAAGGLAAWLGFDGEWIAAMVGLVVITPVDLLARLASGGGDAEEGVAQVGCVGRMLWPSSGGHLMFLPMWVIGVIGLPLTAVGWIAA